MAKLFFLFATLVAFVVAEGNVLDLTPDNFDSVVDGSKGAFVEFFAPWCGHCKRLAPEYEIVGDAFAKVSEVVVAKVDADAHGALGSRFGVTGFPTLKWFPKGSTTPEDYNGGRTADDIVKFINSKAGTKARIPKAPSAVTELDDSNFNSIALDPKKHVLVEFFAPWCGHCKSLAPTYEKLAAAFKNEGEVVIAKVDADAHKSLGSRFGVSGFPTIKFFPKDNKAGVDYNGGRELSDLVNYINEQAGTERQTDGKLSAQAGRIDEFDEITGDFLKGNQDKLLADAEKLAEKNYSESDKKSVKVYLKVLKSVREQGGIYLQNEAQRLDKLLASGSVSAQKADEFQVRLNILNSFKKD